jgi:hypothetical protein
MVWSNGLVPGAAAQRAGGDFHAGGVLVLRMARGQRTPGPQRLQVLQFQAVARQEQLDVKRQRGVARGQDEPVTAQPLRVARIMAHQLLEKKIRSRSQAHRRTRMAVAHLLHRIRSQHADRINGALVQVGPSQARLCVHLFYRRECHLQLFLFSVRLRPSAPAFHGALVCACSG